jgi:hypothetical protein
MATRTWMQAAIACLFGLLIVSAGCRGRSKERKLGNLSLPEHAAPAARELRVAPLTDELRAKGYHECNPHDPLGLGPYAPFRRLSLGRILIPQKGGHSPDMGYDVLVHFHGADALRKFLVQVTRGVVLVLVDKGTGGGPYAKAVESPATYLELRKSIEAALRKHSGDERAHVRRLALSAWSAGTVAIDRILQHDPPDVDAVVILDGLHAGWKNGAKKEPKLSSLDPAFIHREVTAARRALAGELTFVLTHSRVDPGNYPSTGLTAELLLGELGLAAKALDPRGVPFAQISVAEAGKLHVWGFAGGDERAHCAQLAVMPRIVTELLEPAWGTAEMDRSVPMTALPAWQRPGATKKRKRRRR